MEKRFEFRETLRRGQIPIGDYLAEKTGLSKTKIKDAMNKGALLVKRRGKGAQRVRRATAVLRAGDGVEFCYDEALLALMPESPRLIADETEYSVWFKPAGLMTQGTKYADHCSLIRQAELYFGSRREVYPIHRLDREASGLIVVAHSARAASLLSNLFQGREVEKVYRTEVKGVISEGGRVELPLDGKEAVTCFDVASCDRENGVSVLLVRIETGRKHQIRRHLDMVGHPVMGDPRYGSGNKNREGLKLEAVSIGFVSPFGKKRVDYRLPDAPSTGPA